jgi:hypothetical protein
MVPPLTSNPTSWRPPAAAVTAYRIALVGRVLLVRLCGAPTPPMLAALSADVAAARDQVGNGLVYVSVIPKEATAPGPDARPLLTEFARFVSSSCAEVHLVIETTGFAGTIVRSAVTGVAMLSRERNLTVHANLAEAFARIRPPLSLDESMALQRAARELGAVD